MINRGGENVYCVEVENVLAAHPDVLEVAVVGVAGPGDGGEGRRRRPARGRGCAGGRSSPSLIAFAREQLADFKVPQFVRVLDDGAAAQRRRQGAEDDAARLGRLDRGAAGASLTRRVRSCRRRHARTRRASRPQLRTRRLEQAGRRVVLGAVEVVVEHLAEHRLVRGGAREQRHRRAQLLRVDRAEDRDRVVAVEVGERAGALDAAAARAPGGRGRRAPRRGRRSRSAAPCRCGRARRSAGRRTTSSGWSCCPARSSAQRLVVGASRWASTKRCRPKGSLMPATLPLAGAATGRGRCPPWGSASSRSGVGGQRQPRFAAETASIAMVGWCPVRGAQVRGARSRRGCRCRRPVTLTQQEFANGLAYWRDRTRWPADLHNAYYGELAGQNPNGKFDLAWWRTFSRHLTAWKAVRPMSAAELTSRTTSEFESLTQAWQQCCAPFADQSNIADVEWVQAAGWVEVVAAIKPVRSPVFSSKFSHFLLPQVYPVVDGAVMGMPFGASYQSHFDGVRNEWATTPVSTQNDLRAELFSAIGSSPSGQLPGHQQDRRDIPHRSTLFLNCVPPFEARRAEAQRFVGRPGTDEGAGRCCVVLPAWR